MPESESGRPLGEAAEARDDHARGLITDLTDFNVRKRGPSRFSLLWLTLLLVAIGILLLLITRPGPLTSRSEPLNASGTESTVTDQGAALSEPSNEAEGPISGTWAMHWTSANGDERPAFTIRFEGDDRGTVEILNDDTEFDTTFRLEGDRLWFTFTRVFDIEISDSQTVKWPEISIFEGSFHGFDEIKGEWAREDWDCLPDRDPPCAYRPDALGDPARLVRE